MTGLEKLEAEEQKAAMLAEYGYLCATCGKDINRFGTAQLAHLIPKRKKFIQLYGRAVIFHKLNMRPVCSIGRCNDKWSLWNNPVAIEELVTKIVYALAKEKGSVTRKT